MFVKSLEFQRSTAFQHSLDLLQLVEEYRPWFVIPGTERIKPVMVLMVNGGQDENPRFYGQARDAGAVSKRSTVVLCSTANGQRNISVHSRSGCNVCWPSQLETALDAYVLAACSKLTSPSSCHPCRSSSTHASSCCCGWRVYCYVHGLEASAASTLWSAHKPC